MIKFDKMGLSAPLLKALPELNIINPSKIQELAIPILIKEKDKDLIGLAQTGTGKTAAFGLPLIESIDTEKNHTQALILAPTRELSQQIAQQIKAFSKYIMGLKIQVVYGGESISNQIKNLKNTPHIIIATPGRLIDLIKRRSIVLSGIDHVVLDEADEMLNMGFREDLDKILSYADDIKSTWLFSATMAPGIKNIVDKYMNKPNEVIISSGVKVNKDIDHQFFLTQKSNKVEVLKTIIELEKDMRCIVFCRTKNDTQKLSTTLQQFGLPIDAIHGDLSQNQRDNVMKRFKNHSLRFLVATDVAARGIDVNDLTHVIHFNLPDDMEYYTHRSGRTGRAGKLGTSLVLVSKTEKRQLKFIEKKLAINFTPYTFPDIKVLEKKHLLEWSDSIIKTTINQNEIKHCIQEIKDNCNNISKDELLEKLVSKELEKLGINKINNLWEKDEFKNDDRFSGSTNIKYQINLGLIDGVNKESLTKLLMKFGKLKKENIREIVIGERKSSIEIEKNKIEEIEEVFKSYFINGRKIRLKQENNSFKEKNVRKKVFGSQFRGSSSGRFRKKSRKN